MPESSATPAEEVPLLRIGVHNDACVTKRTAPAWFFLEHELGDTTPPDSWPAGYSHPRWKLTARGNEWGRRNDEDLGRGYEVLARAERREDLVALMLLYRLLRVGGAGNHSVASTGGCRQAVDYSHWVELQAHLRERSTSKTKLIACIDRNEGCQPRADGRTT